MIISFASSKGGVGKSTACAAVGARLAQRGEGVLIFDLDQNRTLERWGRKANIEGLTVKAIERDRFYPRIPRGGWLRHNRSYPHRSCGRPQGDGDESDWTLRSRGDPGRPPRKLHVPPSNRSRSTRSTSAAKRKPPRRASRRLSRRNPIRPPKWRSRLQRLRPQQRANREPQRFRRKARRACA